MGFSRQEYWSGLPSPSPGNLPDLRIELVSPVLQADSLTIWDSLVAQRVESACNAGDLSSIPGLGRSPGEENGNPLKYSCLENPMDRERSLAGYSPWSLKSQIQRLNNNKGNPHYLKNGGITELENPKDQ